jgi:hypothetical protein
MSDSSSKNTMVPMLLKTADAAKYLGTSAQMLRLSRHTGELYKGIPTPKFAKCGRIVLYKRSELDTWIDQQQEYKNNDQARIATSLSKKIAHPDR